MWCCGLFQSDSSVQCPHHPNPFIITHLGFHYHFLSDQAQHGPDGLKKLRDGSDEEVESRIGWRSIGLGRCRDVACRVEKFT